MSVFAYLCSVEKRISPIRSDHTQWEKFCVWFLKHWYAGRYWKAVAIAQAQYKNDVLRIRSLEEIV